MLRMTEQKNIKPHYFVVILIYTTALFFFYLKYVPLIQPFQFVLLPILLSIATFTAIRIDWGLYFFVFVFPLINNLPYYFDIFEETPHAPTALVLFLFFFLGWMVHNTFYNDFSKIQHKIYKPLLLFSLLIFISAIINFFRFSNFFPFWSDSVYEFMTNAYGVTSGGAIMSVIMFSLNYLTGFAFFYILVSTSKSPDFIKRLVAVFTTSAFFSLLFGFSQNLFNPQMGSSPLSFDQGIINGTFKDAVSFSAFIAISIPLILGFFLTLKGIVRNFFIFYVPLAGYIIFFTGARIGFLCFFLSLVFFFVLFIKHSAPLKKPWLATLLILVLIIAIVSNLFIFQSKLKNTWVVSRLKQSYGYLKTGQFDLIFWGRTDILWKMAVEMIKDFPISGVGIGGYIIETSNYAKVFKTRFEIPQSTENYFLQVGSELGLIGIFVILWIFWEIIKKIRFAYKNIQKYDKNNCMLLGALAGIFSYLLNIQFHTYIGSHEIKYTFWLLLAIVFISSESKDREKIKTSTKKRFVILASSLILIYGVSHLWNSTHSLSLKRISEKYELQQDFGLYQEEADSEGRIFRWTREYGGITIRNEQPIIRIPLLASHPDIQENPVEVIIFVVEDFFKKKTFLDKIVINNNTWKYYEYSLQNKFSPELILLFKVSRTWNPLKDQGNPDQRDLGVGIGQIQFIDK